MVTLKGNRGFLHAIPSFMNSVKLGRAMIYDAWVNDLLTYIDIYFLVIRL